MQEIQKLLEAMAEVRSEFHRESGIAEVYGGKGVLADIQWQN